MNKVTGVALLKMYFTQPSLEMKELKDLSIPVRQELADAVAVELGFTRTEEPDGKGGTAVFYVKA